MIIPIVCAVHAGPNSLDTVSAVSVHDDDVEVDVEQCSDSEGNSAKTSRQSQATSPPTSASFSDDERLTPEPKTTVSAIGQTSKCANE